MRAIVPQDESPHLEMPAMPSRKLDSERVTAMAMGATVLAARMAALGEGLGLIDERMAWRHALCWRFTRC